VTKHRPVEHGEGLRVVDLATRVEYVGGARDGQSGDRADLPETITSDGGIYRRSVRCAEDGAMRYVWSETTTDRRKRHG
jgi:hypothetical protein